MNQNLWAKSKLPSIKQSRSSSAKEKWTPWTLHLFMSPFRVNDEGEPGLRQFTSPLHGVVTFSRYLWLTFFIAARVQNVTAGWEWSVWKQTTNWTWQRVLQRHRIFFKPLCFNWIWLTESNDKTVDNTSSRTQSGTCSGQCEGGSMSGETCLPKLCGTPALFRAAPVLVFSSQTCNTRIWPLSHCEWAAG